MADLNKDAEKDSWESQAQEKQEKQDKQHHEEVKKSKRLFGMIKGTLNALKEKTVEQKQREKVQEKLLLKLAQEKKEMEEKIEKDILEKKLKVYESRKKDDLSRYKLMMESVQDDHNRYSEFCQTDTSPRIYFSPRNHSQKSRDNLEKYKSLQKPLQFNIEAYMKQEYPPQDPSRDHEMDIEPDNSISL